MGWFKKNEMLEKIEPVKEKDYVNTIQEALVEMSNPNVCEESRWRMLAYILAEMCESEGTDLELESDRRIPKSV